MFPGMPRHTRARVGAQGGHDTRRNLYCTIAVLPEVCTTNSLGRRVQNNRWRNLVFLKTAAKRLKELAYEWRWNSTFQEKLSFVEIVTRPTSKCPVLHLHVKLQYLHIPLGKAEILLKTKSLVLFIYFDFL